MVCPRCGHGGPLVSGCCSACGAVFDHNTVATGVVAVDTTGLPPGATFGATIGLSTLDGAAAGDAGTGTSAGTAATAATATGELGAVATRASGPLKVGQAFGPRYQIIKLLGVGGMGAVYQAWDAELNVAVALKVIRTDRRRGSVSSEAEKRFKNELLLARQVTHKNVVRIHDLGELDGIKYITMPYVQGDDLATVLRRDGKLPVARALRLARQIADGLQAAHEAGVVHRDLKPPNIMVGGAGDDEQALIMDFGISASVDENTAGTIVGTLEYMSPEQGTGQGADARSDFYAFGVILYEMLTGPRPSLASGSERVTAMKQRFEAGLPPLRTVDETIPAPLADLVTRCLERDPASRFQTTAELCAALAALDDQGERIPIPPRFSKRLMAASAVMVLSIVTGTWWLARTPAPQKQHEPVSVLIADFENGTKDPLFDGTLEPALLTALEGASFVSAYRSDAAHRIAAQLRPGSKTMDESLARLVAMREGVNVVVSGAVARQGNGYRVSAKAVNPATGKQIAEREIDVPNRDALLAAVGKLTAPIRKALGDSTSQSKQLAAAETFTAASLEAAHEYSFGQNLQQTNPMEAMRHYRNAVQLDPKMGRAYASLAVISITLKKRDDAANYYRTTLSLLDHMSEREKLRTLAAYYGAFAHDYDKTIETYEQMASLYPGDDVTYNNLSVAYGFKLQFSKAVAAIKRARDLKPASIKYQFNYVTFLMYAGNFAAAVTEAQRIIHEHPTEYEKTYLALGLSLLARGDAEAAREVYAKLERINPSMAAVGKADMEMYFGRYKPALAVLQDGIAADERDHNEGEMALKYIAKAEAHLALGEKPLALRAARKAAELSSDESVRYPAARALIAAGDEAGAENLAAALENTLQIQNRSYAQLIRAEIALVHRQYAQAIDAARAAQKQHNSWISEFLLGRAYLEAEHFVEALASFDVCNKRVGETPDLMFVNSATLRYLPPLYYWTARAQAGVGTSAAATENYRKFMALRVDSDTADPLVAAAQRALAQ